MNELAENYQALAAGVIKQSCLDYLDDLRRIRKHPGNPEIIKDLERQENFFNSEWFDTLSENLDGPTLMHMLQEKERKEYMNARVKKKRSP